MAIDWNEILTEAVPGAIAAGTVAYFVNKKTSSPVITGLSAGGAAMGAIYLSRWVKRTISLPEALPKDTLESLPDETASPVPPENVVPVTPEQVGDNVVDISPESNKASFNSDAFGSTGTV